MFYDPFLNYFNGNYLLGAALPEFSWFKMTLSLVFRYVLNAIISLAIIWVIFESKEYMKFSAVLYVVLFPILLFVTIIRYKQTSKTATLLHFMLGDF